MSTLTIYGISEFLKEPEPIGQFQNSHGFGPVLWSAVSSVFEQEEKHMSIWLDISKWCGKNVLHPAVENVILWSWWANAFVPLSFKRDVIDSLHYCVDYFFDASLVNHWKGIAKCMEDYKGGLGFGYAISQSENVWIDFDEERDENVPRKLDELMRGSIFIPEFKRFKRNWE